MIHSAKKTKTAPSRSVRAKTPTTTLESQIGSRLRQLRIIQGVTQEKLANAAGITFQQIQKYELGKNRISASRLWEFSRLLQTPITYFYGITDDKKPQIAGLAEDQDGFLSFESVDSKETLELIRTYYSIKDPKLRKDLLKLLKQMAAKMQDGEGA